MTFLDKLEFANDSQCMVFISVVDFNVQILQLNDSVIFIKNMNINK